MCLGQETTQGIARAASSWRESAWSHMKRSVATSRDDIRADGHVRISAGVAPRVS